MNSLEAMTAVPDGSRELRVRSRKDDSGQVLIAVEDTGVGIDAQDLDKLFNAFHTTKPDGMGMGLAISRSIVEAHGGRLWATANGGPGAVFQFTLPIATEQQHG
jgi:signal transduction histidine kinase